MAARPGTVIPSEARDLLFTLPKPRSLAKTIVSGRAFRPGTASAVPKG